MLQGTLLNLKSFLQTTSLAVPGVAKFLFGDALKVIEYSRSNDAFGYPLIHCSKPIIMPQNNGFANNQVQYFVELSAFCHLDKTGLATEVEDDEIEKDTQASNILLEIEKKLRAANRAGTIEFLEAPEIEPVPSKWIDAVAGWKMSFTIARGPNVNTCN